MGYDPTGTWNWGDFWSGLGRIALGVGAIVAGVLVLASGVAGIAMVVTAAITTVAGAATVVNGAADIGEAATDYNFMRDGLFAGNEQAYDIYSKVMDTTAMVGSYICGGWLNLNQPRIQAYKNIDKFNYTKTTKKYFPNADVVMKGNVQRSYMQSLWAQKTIIKYGKMLPDKFGLMFVYKNAELGVNVAQQLIWHMLIR